MPHNENGNNKLVIRLLVDKENISLWIFFPLRGILCTLKMKA